MQVNGLVGQKDSESRKQQEAAKVRETWAGNVQVNGQVGQVNSENREQQEAAKVRETWTGNMQVNGQVGQVNSENREQQEAAKVRETWTGNMQVNGQVGQVNSENREQQEAAKVRGTWTGNRSLELSSRDSEAGGQPFYAGPTTGSSLSTNSNNFFFFCVQCDHRVKSSGRGLLGSPLSAVVRQHAPRAWCPLLCLQAKTGSRCGQV